MPAILKTSQVLFASNGTLQSLCSTHGTNLWAIPSSPSTLPHRRNRLRQSQRRTAAESTPGRGSYTVNSDKHSWPDSPSATTVPCPYAIFGLQKGAPYSKKRFYDLVKIYHPDRDSHETLHGGSLSRATRLQRYRLIVEANEILSDSIKKKAYDNCGAGWDGKADVTARRNHHERGWSSFYDQNSPARNATWEDWEQWYQRGQTEQRPLYISNGSFVALILLFAIVGGMHEMSRAGRLSKTLLQQLEAIHDESSKDLIRRRQESQGFQSNDQRMQNFLRSRNPETYLDSPAGE